MLGHPADSRPATLCPALAAPATPAASVGGAFLSGADPAARRRLRVTLLALAIALMGVTDLLLTLTYMRTVGMVEVNPLARAMVAVGGVRQLVMFKLLTIALSAGMLYLLRRHRLSEYGAWVCFGMLLALSLHWVGYNETVVELASARGAFEANLLDSRYVVVEE